MSLSQLRGLPVDPIETNDNVSPKVEVPKNPQNSEGETFRFGTAPQDSGIPETTRSRVAARELNNYLSTNIPGAEESDVMTGSRRSARPSLFSLKRIYDACLESVKMNELETPA